MIYLDYNATTPIDPEVAAAMLPFIHEHFGNPSSPHQFGKTTKTAVEHARQHVAALLNCQPDEIVFTSGGSESNNYAIKGIAWAHHKRGNHIITSQIEHPAVMEVCRYLESDGFEVTYLPVNEFGQVDPNQVEQAIRPETTLISIMHANNEVGTVQPIREIAEIAHQHGVIIHTDAAQSTGKIPVHVTDLGVDLLSVAGHKLYAPKGIGALYIRSGITPEKLIHGASHEGNRRAGTENVIHIVGFGHACLLARQHLPESQTHLRELRDYFEHDLQQYFGDQIRVNGHPEQRLPNTSSVSFKQCIAQEILARLEGVAASAGAACHADNIHISGTLAAMGVPQEYALGTIRFSMGRFTTRHEIEHALAHLKSVIPSLQ